MYLPLSELALKFFSEILKVEPPKEVAVDYCVIWLHGLGAGADDFLGLVDQLKFNKESQVRYLFPNAPKIAITVNQGMVMPGWYDIKYIDITREEDTTGVGKSAELIGQLIDQQIAAGISPRKIILGGFSQGGALALYVALRYPQQLGAVVALSSYLLSPDTISNEIQPHSSNIPLFMAHGLFDPVVPLFLGQEACTKLQNLGFNVAWHTYPMQHTVLEEELQEIDAFLLQRLNG